LPEGAPESARAARVPLLLLLVALGLTVMVYLPGLSGPLLTDDIPQLKGLIDASADPPAALIETYLVSNSGPFGRSVAMATFIGDAVLHGSDIWWWKFSNLLIHLLAGLLVFWLTAQLLAATGTAKSQPPWLAAAVLAAFWLLHPLHVSTVLYTVQRMTELSAVFVLAGLVCYVHGRRSMDLAPRKGWLIVASGFVICFPLALLSKENALLFPVYCTLIELFVFRFQGSASIQKQVKALQGILVFGYVAAGVYLAANFSNLVVKSYAARDFTLLERVLTEGRVLVLYIAQLLRPIQSQMGFFHDDLVLSTGLFNPVTTLFSLLALVALIASAIALRKKLPLYAFGILFFFAAHALESTFFALELMFEHRNYLASFGILLALLALAQLLISRQQAKSAIVIIGLLALSFLTYQRALTWASPATMYDFMYYAHPQSPRLSYILADVHAQVEEYDRARQVLDNIRPGLGTGMYFLYLDCLQAGQLNAKSIAEVAQIPGGKLDGNVIANTKLLAEAVEARRCTVPAQSMQPLLDHLLTLPYRSPIDQQALRDFKTRLAAQTPAD
jgi:hypothetical protein